MTPPSLVFAFSGRPRYGDGSSVIDIQLIAEAAFPVIPYDGKTLWVR
jgi:hypothetical protein